MNATVQHGMADYYSYNDEDANKAAKTNAVEDAAGALADLTKRKRGSNATAPRKEKGQERDGRRWQRTPVTSLVQRCNRDLPVLPCKPL